jgi:xanthine/CO dehydrogenase XdhC/CoxF family maturation factor
MKGRNFLTGFLLAVGSALAAIVFRRRAARRRERAEIYLADGSLVSLVEGQPGADRLLQHARELLAAARSS